MSVFLINPEQMLIGKLSRGSYKPFNINDKVVIEKNLYNLLGARLIFKGYYNEEEKLIAETIGYNTKEKTPYLVGYKKNSKDDFIKRYTKEYENIMKEKNRFEGLIKTQGRTEYLNDLEIIIIASNYSDDEVKSAENSPYIINLYTWTLVGEILLFNKIY